MLLYCFLLFCLISLTLFLGYRFGFSVGVSSQLPVGSKFKTDDTTSILHDHPSYYHDTCHVWLTKFGFPTEDDLLRYDKENNKLINTGQVHVMDLDDRVHQIAKEWSVYRKALFRLYFAATHQQGRYYNAYDQLIMLVVNDCKNWSLDEKFFKIPYTGEKELDFMGIPRSVVDLDKAKKRFEPEFKHDYKEVL